jgi:serine/threonine protein kinase
MSKALAKKLAILCMAWTASTVGSFEPCRPYKEFNEHFKNELSKKNVMVLWDNSEIVAKGSFGEVRYLPWHIDKESKVREVAVKKATKDKSVELMREIKILQLFNKNNIKYQLGYIGCMIFVDATFLFMEKMDGIIKSSHAKSFQNEFYDQFVDFKPEQRLNIYSILFEALSEIHRAGIKHQDIKPENIFWKQENEKVTIKIADFGLSTDLKGPVFAGTPPYIDKVKVLMYSKELSLETIKIIKERNDFHLADIWAMGVTIFELENSVWFNELPYKKINFNDLNPERIEKRFKELHENFTSSKWIIDRKLDLCDSAKKICFRDIINKIFQQREIDGVEAPSDPMNDALSIANSIKAILPGIFQPIVIKKKTNKQEKTQFEGNEIGNDGCYCGVLSRLDFLGIFI